MTKPTQKDLAEKALNAKAAAQRPPHPETTPTDHGVEPKDDQNPEAARQTSQEIAHSESIGRSGGVRQSDQG